MTLLCLPWALQMTKDPGTKLRRRRQFAVPLPEFREGCKEDKKKEEAVTETWVNDTDEDSTLEAGGFLSGFIWSVSQQGKHRQAGRGRCLPGYKLQMVQTYHCQGTALLTRLLPRLLRPILFFYFSSSEGTPSDICFGGKHPHQLDETFKVAKAIYILRDASEMRH